MFSISTLRLYICSAGLRPIANLGAPTEVRLRGAARAVSLGRKRGRRRQPTRLSFPPVNRQLQHLHQARLPRCYASLDASCEFE